MILFAFVIQSAASSNGQNSTRLRFLCGMEDGGCGMTHATIWEGKPSSYPLYSKQLDTLSADFLTHHVIRPLASLSGLNSTEKVKRRRNCSLFII